MNRYCFTRKGKRRKKIFGRRLAVWLGDVLWLPFDSTLRRVRRTRPIVKPANCQTAMFECSNVVMPECSNEGRFGAPFAQFDKSRNPSLIWTAGFDTICLCFPSAGGPGGRCRAEANDGFGWSRPTRQSGLTRENAAMVATSVFPFYGQRKVTKRWICLPLRPRA